MSSYFVISCARSGSTSLARILDTASNGICALEPSPNLNRETRERMDGRLVDPYVIIAPVCRRVWNSEIEVYGEKNVTYGPFIPHLHEILDCKFVFLKRDGRDVVRSLMDWHNQMWGSIYRECKDAGELSPRAVKAAGGLPVHKDTSDYSRPRPAKGDPFYDEWEYFNREEMCAYYWSYINNLYLDQLGKLPRENWIELDYTNPSAEDVIRAVEFLELEGITENRVQEMLDNKINSLKERTGKDASYPRWMDWDGGLRRKFDRIAADTMTRMGYYHNGQHSEVNWKPQGYGKFWYEQGPDIDWYTWMYNGRIKMHTDLVEWVKRIEDQGERIKSVADVGCGLGVGYCDNFADKYYMGLDISPSNVTWCRQHRENTRHRYLNVDIMSSPFRERGFDLVFSTGTIDNTYDIDQFLQSMVQSSRGWVYLTCYRGWFPELDEHRYSWNEEHGCFYNDLSPRRARETLEELGCKDVVVERVETGNRDVPFETRIIARIS